MKDIIRTDVICFGGGDWWYHNRAHIDMQLMRRFARNGTVVYVNSIVIQKPRLGRGGNLVHKIIRKLKSISKGLKESGEGFWVYTPKTLPVHHISWLRPFNEMLLRVQVNRIIRKLNISNPIVWVACPGACDTALRLKKSRLVWQRTDRWEEFPNVDSEVIKGYDRKLKANADLTVFVSDRLYSDEGKDCRKAFYLDHGVDYEMFAGAQAQQFGPPDIANIKRPIAGFFGGMDSHTSDIAFLEKVIELLPEVSFVFIGSVSCDCSGLLSKKNVWMLGQRPYSEIPHYGECFDVAIMAWNRNRWIEGCNPIKLKEYLALGKPVVSTPFPELKKYRDVVYEASSPEDFARCVMTAIKEDNPSRAAMRQEKVKDASWNAKAELVLKQLA